MDDDAKALLREALGLYKRHVELLEEHGARLQAGATQCSPSNYSYHCSESWLPCLFGFIFSRFEMQRVGENPSELICKEVLNRAAADSPFRVSDNC